MSNSNSRKRNLPSWMGSREDKNDDDDNSSKQPRNQGKQSKDQYPINHHHGISNKFTSGTSSSASDISKLMEGIVFVLSGFVNPERGILRSQMLEMGAQYQMDWNSDCTLLVCAFDNTPKLRQVKAEGGTVISKEWISECYNNKKLVDIEPYLLHAGKPWRKQPKSSEDIKPPASSKSLKPEEKGLHSKKTTSSNKIKGFFSPLKVKKWAVDDLKRTLSWLGSQDEKPEPSEINKIAAEGILTCLQDAIDCLKKGQGVQQVADQWSCIPQLVEELTKLDSSNNGHSKEDLCKEAMVCKRIYELEFLNMENGDLLVNKKGSPSKGNSNKNKGKVASDEPSYDSDETIEMTEDEIEQAFNTIACSL